VLDKKPVITKAITAAIGMGLGDIIAQLALGGGGGGGMILDPSRLLRQASFGLLLAGPIGHLWYNTLDQYVLPKKAKSTPVVLLKMALDQLLWSPLFTVVFFSWLGLWQGQGLVDITATVQAKLLPTMLANWTLWPLAHLVNFKYVPSRQRILYVNVVNVLWNVYLSGMANWETHHHDGMGEL